MTEVLRERGLLSRGAMEREYRLDLARRAMRAAVDTRVEIGIGLDQPVCAYSACERLGIPVRFVDVNMEGIYRRAPTPRILLSAHRPLGRRHFNCAHELGHHLFGHGATLDECQENIAEPELRSRDEILADSFAAHFLMPVLGVRLAFARRRIEPRDAKPEVILAIATEFGVGYETLLTHLAWSLGNITPGRRSELLRARQALRRLMIPPVVTGPIALVDDGFAAPTLDIEVNCLVIAPQGAKPSDGAIVPVADSPFGPIFRAIKRGIVELAVPKTAWATTLRVSAENFVGLAHFRHLEDFDD